MIEQSNLKTLKNGEIIYNKIKVVF